MIDEPRKPLPIGLRYATGGQRKERSGERLDFFPTPPWATRALCEFIRAGHPDISRLSAWDPCAGAGHMARPLHEYFRFVHATDIKRYPRTLRPVTRADFLEQFPTPLNTPAADWIIMNPPFSRLGEFILHARKLATQGVACLTRVQALEGITRHRDIWSKDPPTYVLQFTERVPMAEGILDPKGSTATGYAWLVWDRSCHLMPGPLFRWIPPCRRDLERDGDYPEDWRTKPEGNYPLEWREPHAEEGPDETA